MPIIQENLLKDRLTCESENRQKTQNSKSLGNIVSLDVINLNRHMGDLITFL